MVEQDDGKGRSSMTETKTTYCHLEVGSLYREKQNEQSIVMIVSIDKILRFTVEDEISIKYLWNERVLEVRHSPKKMQNLWNELMIRVR